MPPPSSTLTPERGTVKADGPFLCTTKGIKTQAITTRPTIATNLHHAACQASDRRFDGPATLDQPFGALALLCNTMPRGAILTVLVLTFGAVSGAHFNRRECRLRATPGAKVAGGCRLSAEYRSGCSMLVLPYRLLAA